MTHVFIVNEQTIKIHLDYMFAGTGGSKDASFLQNNEIQLNWKSEFNVVDMISDISRIKNGDKILFYVQASGNSPGRFYGVFKAKGSPFYDSNENNYLYDKLNKSLNFRVEIEPDIVYSKGISEHDALDILDDITHPSQMCWSLIYRKLKGNRGCTMITDFEAEKIISKINLYNLGRILNGESFTYDSDLKQIVESNKTFKYMGIKQTLSIKDRMIFKYNRGNAFESHLQALIIQNLLKSPLQELLHINPDKKIWIGNEVACGVGMQRIDVATIQEYDQFVLINIIELKSCTPYGQIITDQLPWYITWIKNYWGPLYSNKTVKINPIVIALKLGDNTEFKNICESLVYPSQDNIGVSSVEYISFEIYDNDIFFTKEF